MKVRCRRSSRLPEREAKSRAPETPANEHLSRGSTPTADLSGPVVAAPGDREHFLVVRRPKHLHPTSSSEHVSPANRGFTLAPECTVAYNLRMARRNAKAPDAAKHGRRSLTDEQRRQLSERAKEMHRQGKIGGAKYGRMGGRPRKPRASEAVAEAAEQHSAEIVAALRIGVRQGTPEQRSRSAERFLALAQREDQLRLKAQEAASREKRDLSRDQVMQELVEKLTAGPMGALLRERLGALPDVVEGHAVEVPAAS